MSGDFGSFFMIVTQLILGFFFLARTLKMSQIVALWMRTKVMHLELRCVRRYAMAQARGYAMARQRLVFFFSFFFFFIPIVATFFVHSF